MPDRSGLNAGNYYGPSEGTDSCTAARRDFATRSPCLVQKIWSFFCFPFNENKKRGTCFCRDRHRRPLFFNTRSGLIPRSALFDQKQLLAIFHCCVEVQAGLYSITDEQGKCLQSIVDQIRLNLPNLGELLDQEMELPAAVFQTVPAVHIRRRRAVAAEDRAAMAAWREIRHHLQRVQALREMGVEPFVQPYRDYDGGEPTEEQKAFARWVNRKSLFNRHPHDVELSIKMEAAFPAGQPHGPLPQRQMPPWPDYLGHQFLPEELADPELVGDDTLLLILCAAVTARYGPEVMRIGRDRIC